MALKSANKTGAKPAASTAIKPAAKAHRGAHEVRIIGGQWKRSKLAVLDREGLRPTPDRVRETLFNWLGQDLTGWQVLDAFAGTGVLGFEAASRGAAQVQLLERDSALVKPLVDAKAKLKATTVQLLTTDAMAWMARAPHAHFDLVLLDPPFGSGLHALAIERAAPLVKPEGFMYVEAPEALLPPPGWLAFRHLRAGAVHAHLWQRGPVVAATLDQARENRDDEARED